MNKLKLVAVDKDNDYREEIFASESQGRLIEKGMQLIKEISKDKLLHKFDDGTTEPFDWLEILDDSKFPLYTITTSRVYERVLDVKSDIEVCTDICNRYIHDLSVKVYSLENDTGFIKVDCDNLAYYYSSLKEVIGCEVEGFVEDCVAYENGNINNECESWLSLGNFLWLCFRMNLSEFFEKDSNEQKYCEYMQNLALEGEFGGIQIPINYLSYNEFCNKSRRNL